VPVKQPFDLVQRGVPAVGAKELGGVPRAAEQRSRARRCLGRHAVGALERRRLARLHIAPDHILSGPLEGAQGTHLVRLGRVPRQRDAVRSAPGALRPEEDALNAREHRLVVGVPKGRRLRATVVPERGKPQCNVGGPALLHLVQQALGVRLGVRPPARRAPERARLVGEHADDGLAKVPAQVAVVRVVGDAQEGGHRVPVHDVPGGRRQRVPVVLLREDAADRPAAEDVPGGDQPPAAGREVEGDDLMRVRRQQPQALRVKRAGSVLPRGNDADQHVPHGTARVRPPEAPRGSVHRALDGHEAAGGIVRVLCHYLALRGARRVVTLIVEDDLHPQPARLVHGEGHQTKELVRKVANGARKAQVSVRHKTAKAAGVHLADLAHQFALVQSVVPGPEGQQAELLRRSEKKRAHVIRARAGAACPHRGHEPSPPARCHMRRPYL